MPPQDKKKNLTSKERGLALRKTHFTLGEGQSIFIVAFSNLTIFLENLNRSEYGNEYFLKQR